MWAKEILQPSKVLGHSQTRHESAVRATLLLLIENDRCYIVKDGIEENVSHSHLSLSVRLDFQHWFT